jgi:hypothetical protein
MRYYWPIHYFLNLQENLSEQWIVLQCLMKDGPSVPVGWGRGKISSRKLTNEPYAKVGDSPQEHCCDIAAMRHHHLPRSAGGGWIYPLGGHRRPILCGRWHDSGPNRIPWRKIFRCLPAHFSGLLGPQECHNFSPSQLLHCWLLRGQPARP